MSLPLRTCLGCRKVVPQAELLRFTLVADQPTADADFRRPGRGAYVHPDCLETAIRRNLLRRRLRTRSRSTK